MVKPLRSMQLKPEEPEIPHRFDQQIGWEVDKSDKQLYQISM